MYIYILYVSIYCSYPFCRNKYALILDQEYTIFQFLTNRNKKIDCSLVHRKGFFIHVFMGG